MISVLTGTNSFAVKQELQKLPADFIAKYGESGVEYIYSDQIDVEQLNLALTNVSLFATHKFVVIKNISKVQNLGEHFLKIASLIPEEVQVILLEEHIDKRTAFYKALKKDFDIINLDTLSDQELAKWIVQKVKEDGGLITSLNAQKLISFVGADQLSLASEIQKLITYQPEITEVTIQELIDKRPEETVFQLLESCISGRVKQSLELLNGLEKAHEDPYAIANMIIWQTHILSVVASAGKFSDTEISKQSKINPYVIQKTKRLTHGLSAENLKNIVDRAAEMDIKLKTTTINPWQIIQNTILNF